MGDMGGGVDGADSLVIKGKRSSQRAGGQWGQG